MNGTVAGDVVAAAAGAAFGAYLTMLRYTTQRYRGVSSGLLSTGGFFLASFCVLLTAPLHGQSLLPAGGSSNGSAPAAAAAAVGHAQRERERGGRHRQLRQHQKDDGVAKAQPRRDVRHGERRDRGHGQVCTRGLCYAGTCAWPH